MLPSAAAAPAPAADLLQAILDVSLTGIIVFRPLYDPADPATITDLAYVHLNPAAQRMLQLPECPTESFLTLFPSAVDAGIFAFHRDTFLAGGPGRYDVNYQADGLDNYFHLASRRAGDRLVVSFTDTADHPRSPVETALRAAQAAEQVARAEAEAQRQRLHHLLLNLPAITATYCGPTHVYELVSPGFQRLFPARSLPAFAKPCRNWPARACSSYSTMSTKPGSPTTARKCPPRSTTPIPASSNSATTTCTSRPRATPRAPSTGCSASPTT